MPSLALGGVVAAAIVVIILLFALSYHVADADECLVITGPGRTRYVVGGSALIFPFVWKVNKLNLGKITIALETDANQPIPTQDYIMLNMSAVATVQIGTGSFTDRNGENREMLAIAARNYLNQKKTVMEHDISEIMLGKMREATGATKLADLIRNRDAFNDTVTKAATDDMNALGLELVAFNVQDFYDRAGVGMDGRPTSVIRQMGAAQSAEISRDARIASIEADEKVADRNNEYQLKLADLKTQQDTAKAKADMTYDITSAERKKELNVAQQDAEIAAEERRAVLAERKAATAEKELDATVRKQADAQRYAAEQDAEAKLYTRRKDAEAELYTRRQEAEAVKVNAEAQAEATRKTADADAHATEVKGDAEGKALRHRGEGEAAGISAQVKAYNATTNNLILAQQYIQVMPEIARAVSEPLRSVDSITMYGDGNTTRLLADTTNGVSQVSNALESALGIDLKGLLNAAVGGHMAGAAMRGDAVADDAGSANSTEPSRDGSASAPADGDEPDPADWHDAATRIERETTGDTGV